VNLDDIVRHGPGRHITDHAACRGLNGALFHSFNPPDMEQAKAVCGGCPVRQDCLDYALDAPEYYGIWGGLDAKERRRIRRARRLAATPPPPPPDVDPDTTQECQVCGEVLPVAAFYTRVDHGRRRYHTWCKACSIKASVARKRRTRAAAAS
jgi:WhiB family redox-sensing transcriptional regulator